MNKTISFLTIFVVLTAFFLGACASGEEVLKIGDTTFAKMLVVQKVENDTSDEALTKSITDETKVEETLKLVSGLKVKELSTDEFVNKLKSQNSYSFSFFKTEQDTSGMIPYAFYVLEDGTMMFTFEEVDSLREKPLITINAEKELLDKIKDHLEIEF
ncbi:hypothetical protein FZC79_15260 [Rossellomorea vietnamensis]|uniref:Lipoprotein n=1 Tax=Rossellomorea vietnamensis TaxID=218284 RepID=A0A5D4K9V8_9BACI|nr:hypothetical protein [Rossellomorea vietnamensis]TYR74174.1 hypothetical protein FZC79_15260 [Rossellomorea vietnamensis]